MLPCKIILLLLIATLQKGQLWTRLWNNEELIMRPM